MQQDIRRLLKALWKRMCRHDGISTNSHGRHRYDDCRFVAFSEENPYQERYNRIVRLYMGALR